MNNVYFYFLMCVPIPRQDEKSLKWLKIANFHFQLGFQFNFLFKENMLCSKL